MFEAPLQISLCMIFLYNLLGWRCVQGSSVGSIWYWTDHASDSALVGLAMMLITLPLPGWITKHIQGSQREKMKRVCDVVTLVERFSPPRT